MFITYFILQLYMNRESYTDDLFKESDDLNLIVSYYQKKGQPEKAVKHIKRIFDGYLENPTRSSLVEDLKRYRDFLSEEDQKKYINAYVDKTIDHPHDAAARIAIIEEFSELIDKKRFSTFFCNTIRSNAGWISYHYSGLDMIYRWLEKHKERLDKEELKPALVLALIKYMDEGAKKNDIDRFAQYLDEKTKSLLVIGAMEMTYPYAWKNASEKDKPAKIFERFKVYLNKDFVYAIVEENVSRILRADQILGMHISMSAEKNMINLLKNDFFTEDQVKGLLEKIIKKQFGYSKQGYYQKDPAGDIQEDPDPDYGVPFAFETLKQFPDKIDRELAQEIARKMLAIMFYEEAAKDYPRSARLCGTAKDSIKALKDIIDRDTIELALADAVRAGWRWTSLGYSEDILKKFKRYINKKYIAEAAAEKLSEDPLYIINKFGSYLSDEQIKEAVRSSAREDALKDHFEDISRLVESSRSKFTKEELSDFFSGLFEEVKEKIQISEFKIRERKKQDAVLEFLDQFSEYIPRNAKTEQFYELLDIKKEL